MKPSKLIRQTSPAALSEVRREITGKAFRQEHSTRDKKKLLAKIEEIEKIIARLGYQIKIEKMKKAGLNKETGIITLWGNGEKYWYVHPNGDVTTTNTFPVSSPGPNFLKTKHTTGFEGNIGESGYSELKKDIEGVNRPQKSRLYKYRKNLHSMTF